MYFLFYFISDCGFDVHKKYVNLVEETCVGPSVVHRKRPNADQKKRNKFGRLLSDLDLPGRKQSNLGKPTIVCGCLLFSPLSTFTICVHFIHFTHFIPYSFWGPFHSSLFHSLTLYFILYAFCQCGMNVEL